MASSSTSARELKDLVATKQKEDESPEGQQLFVLRSRVEQQADLIMMLKQRNEELKQQLEQTEKDLKESQQRATNLVDNMREAVKAKERVEQNFKTLNSNHEQMLLMKDQYKVESEQLRKRLAVADAQAAERIAIACKETEQTVAKLTVQLHDTTSRLEILTAREVAVAEENKSVVADTRAELESLRVEVDQLTMLRDVAQRDYQTVFTQSQQAKKKADDEIATLRATGAERDRALATEHSRCTALAAELEAAAIKMGQLQQSLEVAQVAADEASAARARAEQEMSGDSLVHRLASITQEYAAFKKHSTELLAKEREINARLRHLSQK